MTMMSDPYEWTWRGWVAAILPILVLLGPGVVTSHAAEGEATYSKDIAPILQRSCERCHRPGQIAPMSLTSYEEARPYARAIKNRTQLRNRQGVMPPWMIEKNIGIQGYKGDISLSEAEIQLIADWADNGAARGKPRRPPPAS